MVAYSENFSFHCSRGIQTLETNTSTGAISLFYVTIFIQSLSEDIIYLYSGVGVASRITDSASCYSPKYLKYLTSCFYIENVIVLAM